jgi:hypothetical protein
MGRILGYFFHYRGEYKKAPLGCFFFIDESLFTGSQHGLDVLELLRAVA